METSYTLLQGAKAIVSCDAQDTIYNNCDILIQGAKIVKIGQGITQEGAKSIDATGKFIYPGLVNTHHHFFQTFVRNLQKIDYPNMTVVDWLDRIYPLFQLVNSEVIYYSSLTALADLVKHGCTCAFDHQYCYTQNTGKDTVDRQMQAAEELGIRYHAGRGVNTLPKQQGSTIPPGMLESTDEFLQDCQRLIDTYHDSAPFSMRQIVVAPCQPINSYPDTFKEAARLARHNGVRLHTHLGEGENQIMQQRFGKRSLAWCEEIGFVGPDVWFAHGWELLPQEFDVLRQTQSGISHCPAPAVLGGFPILDIPAMQKAGVCISLGCDGSATNDSSNLLDSLRMAYLMQAYHSKARGGGPSAYEMLKIATVNGAKTLGRNDIGFLAPGMAADLFMLDTEKLELCGALHDPANLPARAGLTGPVWLTMVNGQVVYENGRLTKVDEARLAREGEEVCTRVLRSNKSYPL